MTLVTAHRADAVRATGSVTELTIAITEPLPDYRDHGDSEAIFAQDANAIHVALKAALPGGTIDRLFAVMAADRASVLVVPRH